MTTEQKISSSVMLRRGDKQHTYLGQTLVPAVIGTTFEFNRSIYKIVDWYSEWAPHQWCEIYVELVSHDL